MDNIGIIEKELKEKTAEYAVIPSAKIEFSREMVKGCEVNYCGRYNTNWTCPPAAGDVAVLEKRYKSYNSALVFTTIHKLEDQFDIEGMDKARTEHLRVEKLLLDKTGRESVNWLSAGSCNICEKCTYPDLPCRFPHLARPSLEACGINVTELAKICNIRYYNGENTVTYFSAIFFNNKDNSIYN